MAAAGVNTASCPPRQRHDLSHGAAAPALAPARLPHGRPSSCLAPASLVLTAPSTLRPSVVCMATGGISSKQRIEEWEKARSAMAGKVRSVSPEEAVQLVSKNQYKILDVRPVEEFEEVHPEGAVNAQIYRLIKEWTPYDIARRAAFAFFGVFNGTEDNPDFLQDVEKVASKDDGLIVACMMGGSLKPSANFPQGRESRSLNAAYKLVAGGYNKVLHLDGGLSTYFREEHPVIVKDD